MRRFRDTCQALVAAAGLTLLVGGCPNDLANPLDPSGNHDDAGGGGAEAKVLSQKEMLSSLSRASFADNAEQIAAESAEEVVPESTPFFGESQADFDAVAFDAIEITDDALLEEVDPNSEAPEPSVKGGLTGIWRPRDGGDDRADGGLIRGRWFNAEGTAVGVLRGFYRPTPNRDLPEGLLDAGVFQARIIDDAGRFRGLLRGWYGYNADGEGAFYGRWFDRFLRVVGVTKGAWSDVADQLGGEFAGRWAGFELCDAADSIAQDPNAAKNALSGLDPFESTAPVEPSAFSDLETLATTATLDPNANLDSLEGELDLEAGEGDAPCVDPEREFGYLRGRYQPEFNPRTPFDGTWRGRWIAADGDPRGWVLGRWSRRDDLPGGDDGGLADIGGEATQPAGPPFAGPRPRVGPRQQEMDDEGGDPNSVDGEEPPAGPTDRPLVRGTFRGVIVNDAREVIGYIEGVYGRGRFGMGVLAARHFDAGGDFRGRMRGRWQDDAYRAGGSIFGVWGVAPQADEPGDPNAPSDPNSAG